MLLGEYIKEYRTAHNEMSQDAFAKLSGISKGYISMLENNKNPRTKFPISPTIDTYKKVAKAVGITLNELFAIVDSPVDISNSHSFENSSAIPKTDPSQLYEVRIISYEFSDDERQLISCYRAINREGQEKLLDYADDLMQSGKYKKTDAPELGSSQIHPR